MVSLQALRPLVTPAHTATDTQVQVTKASLLTIWVSRYDWVSRNLEGAEHPTLVPCSEA